MRIGARIPWLAFVVWMSGCAIAIAQTPTLTIVVADGPAPNPACHVAGSSLSVKVLVGPSAASIFGGQFLLEYNPLCLDFVSAEPGAVCDPTSPFNMEISETPNEAVGQLFMAVAAPPEGNGTAVGGVLACLNFKRLGGCVPCQLCFDDENPQNTHLTDKEGGVIEPELSNDGCSDLVHERGSILMTCPMNAQAHADCSTGTGFVPWIPPSAVDSCDGTLVLNCSGINSEGEPVNLYINGGGAIPPGISTFTCDAANSCGDSGGCQWQVTVSDLTTLQAVVQLSPTITANEISRCIEFELFQDCGTDPLVVSDELTFGGAGNAPGWASASFKVQQGPYFCVTARDPLHTVRSSAVPQCLPNGNLYVEFSESPEAGGNWLIGGNLNRSAIIDILDFGVLVNQYLTLKPTDTTCAQASDTQYRHADVSGDGVADLIELSFIMINFLANDKSTCCAGGSSEEGFTEISVPELAQMGMPEIILADLNGDDWVNLLDVSVLLSGGYIPPIQPPVAAPIHPRSNPAGID